MQSHGKDLKGQTLSAFCFASNLVAGGSGDNTELVGSTIDISALASRPSAVVFEVASKAVLAATATLVVAGEVEQSVDGSTWTDAVASATLTTLTGASGGSTETGVARIGVDLINSNINYIRIKATPNLSAANTDTAVVAAVAVFGGLQNT